VLGGVSLRKFHETRLRVDSDSSLKKIIYVCIGGDEDGNEAWNPHEDYSD
jgi:hypothetical protein